MIPRSLHRIWWNPPMPPEFDLYGREWQALHPDWLYTEWRDIEEVRDGFRNPALLDRAPAKDGHRWRADIARLELLHLFGGVYLDADIAPIRAIDDLATGEDLLLCWSANRGPGGSLVVSNAVIMSPPGHPFLAAAIDTMPDSVAAHRGKPTAQVTGPWHLQRLLDRQPWPSVRVLPSRLFYPQSNADRDRGLLPDLSSSYGWHRWATSRDRR